MKVVITDDWIKVEEGPEMPVGDEEWSCRKSVNIAAAWAIKRLSDELQKNIAAAGGGRIASR